MFFLLAHDSDNSSLLACVPTACGRLFPSAAPTNWKALGRTSVGNDGATNRCAPNASARFFPAHRAALNSKCPFTHSSRKRPLSGSRYGRFAGSGSALPGESPGVSSAGPPKKGLNRSLNRFNIHFPNTTRIRAAYPGHRILRGAPACLPRAFPARGHEGLITRTYQALKRGRTCQSTVCTSCPLGVFAPDSGSPTATRRALPIAARGREATGQMLIQRIFFGAAQQTKQDHG